MDWSSAILRLSFSALLLGTALIGAAGLLTTVQVLQFFDLPTGGIISPILITLVTVSGGLTVYKYLL